MTLKPRPSPIDLRASLVLIAALTATQAHASPSYELSPVDSHLSLPQMNASGTIVGNFQNQWGIFQNGQTQLIDRPAGTTFSYAIAMNDHGTVLGQAYSTSVVGGTLEHGGYTVTDNRQQFLYQDGKATNLQQVIGLPVVSAGPGASAWVSALNNSGELAGTINHAESASSEAFVYRDGQVQTIATPSNWSTVSAFAINNLGVIVGGYAYLNPGESHYVNGVFLDDHGKLTDLGGGFALVRGFNDNGQILLERDSGTSIYDNGHFMALNNGDGATASDFFRAQGLGGDGTVIGYSLSDSYQAIPILYANGQRLDPNTLLDAQTASQHHITELLTINSHGDILGLDQNGQQVLLKPLSAVPEMSTLNLMALGLALAGIGRLRARIKRAQP